MLANLLLGATKKLETFVTVLQTYVLRMPKDKTFGSGKIMRFLVYELDTEMVEVILPIDNDKRLSSSYQAKSLTKQKV